MATLDQINNAIKESGPQGKTVRYARSKGLMAHRNYMGPGCEVGWPDVEIFMPRARMLLLEFKREGQELKKIQEHRAERLRKMGFEVIRVVTFEEAKAAIDERNR